MKNWLKMLVSSLTQVLNFSILHEIGESYFIYITNSKFHVRSIIHLLFKIVVLNAHNYTGHNLQNV